MLKLGVPGNVRILGVLEEVRILFLGEVFKLVVAKVFLVSEKSLVVCL